MTSPKKTNLDLHQPSLDIISELINRQLEHIAWDILTHLSDVDLSNAIVANPKWSAVATSRRRIKQLISKSNEKATLLKAMYKREEVLARKTQDSSEAHSLFLRACTKYSNLNTSHSKLKNDGGEHFLSLHSTSGTTSAFVRQVFMSSEFIVLVYDGGPPGRTDAYKDTQHFIKLFDRWTFKLVQSLPIKCGMLNLRFIKGSVDAVQVYCLVKRAVIASFWHLTTGKLHVAPGSPCSDSVISSFNVAKLLVFVLRINGDTFATVYKVDVESDEKFVCLVERESLEPWSVASCVPDSEDLDYFAICLSRLPDDPYRSSFQVRSKEDFSLLRLVATTECFSVSLSNSRLFSEALVFVYNNEDSSVDVVSPVHESYSRIVHRFRLPQEVLRQPSHLWTLVVLESRFLVLYKDLRGFHAAIWKLPLDFAEICHRHCNERTVGVTPHCDQQIVDERVANQSFRAFYEIDRYGIMKSCIDKRRPTVAHVTMLNSIISDLED